MKKIIFFFSFFFYSSIAESKVYEFYCEGEWEWKWDRGQEIDFVLEPRERDSILTIDTKNKKMKWKEVNNIINNNDYFVEAPMTENNEYYITFYIDNWSYTFSRYTGRLTMIYSKSYFHKIRYNCFDNLKKII